jgi:hypothetical protein
VCYNGTATLKCGDAGFTFNETTNAATLTGSMTAFGLITNSTGAGTPNYFTVPALTALTGADNIIIGSAAAAALTTGHSNVVLGANAGDGSSTGLLQSVCVGMNACTGSNIGGPNTAVGFAAMDATTATAAVNNTAIGSNSLGALTTGTGNTGVGTSSCAAITSTANNVCVGVSANTSAGVAGGTAIGASTSVTGSAGIALGTGATAGANQFVIGGNTNQISDVYIGEGATNVTPVDVTVQATGGSGTDIAGADMRVAGGKGTGTGAGGDLVGLTSPALTTGTTLQTLEVRAQIVAKQFALTDNTIATFATQALGNDTGGGATVDFCVKAKDATDEQMECGSVYFAGVDITAGAGGETCSTPTVVGTTEAVSAGTLGVTFANTAGTDLCSWRVTSDTSLTTTEHYIKFSITHNSGQVITPQ